MFCDERNNMAKTRLTMLKSVEDIVKTRIPADWTRDDVYER